MNRMSYWLVLLGLVTINIYIADSYTVTSSVLTQMGYDTQSSYIDIEDNAVDSIDPNALNGYDKINSILISSTNILTIDLEVFKGSVNVKWMFLNVTSLNKLTNSNNVKFQYLRQLIVNSNLTNLNKPMFSAFPALYWFDAGNFENAARSIKTVDVHTFESLSNLSNLDLRLNSITSFEYLQIPKNLKSLILTGNNMNYFALSITMGVLSYLDISNNRFRSFKSMNFTFLANLTELYLQNNPHAYPNEISGHMKPLVKLERVDLRNLSINSIDSNFFTTNTKLQYIDLSQNKINYLDSGAFNGLIDLYSIYLSYNSLTKISSGTFNNPYLIRLDLNDNQISQIDSSTFFGDSLYYTDINLNTNKLTKILPNTFHNTFNSIDLSNNLINEIDNSFEGLTGVKKLLLGNNKIAKIAPGSFNNLVINNLDLSYNDLTTINNTIFAGQNRIQIIKLGYNKLTTIETGSFANMPYLLEVYLDNNQLTQLDSSVFAGSNNLVKISVTGNPNLSTGNIQSLCPTSATYCQVLY